MSPRALPALALFFLCGTLVAQAPQPEFRTLAGKQIWDVVRFSPPGFQLGLGDGAPFVLYGELPGEYVQVKCERSSSFRLIAFANEAGGVNLGVCTQQVKRLGALSAAARPAIDALVAELFRGRTAPEAAARARLGLDYLRHTFPDGSQEHAFTVLLVGHGIIPVQTVIFVPSGSERAVVVQANVHKLCEDFGPRLQTPLCTDTRKALSDIARRIDACCGQVR